MATNLVRIILDSTLQPMSGRRLLDAARLFNASRCVAKQHIKLRSHQLDVFTKTSTLAKLAKDQTDRITLTAQAAIAIATKLNRQPPSYPYSTSYPPPHQKPADHHYTPPPPPPEGELSVKQEKESSKPLPDGTIPPTDANYPLYTRHEESNADYSSLPHAKIPKHIENTQAGDEKVDSKGINSDSYYSTERDREAAHFLDDSKTTYEDAVPPNVDINVFRTSKVSKLLGVESKRVRLPGSGPPGAVKTHAPSSQPPTRQQETSEEAFKSLAEDIAKDATAPLEPAPYQMRESRVPSSRLGRLWEYSGLATSMAFGAVGEGLRRVTGGGAGGSLMLSAGNMERLVAKLSRMRGAALKLGQMISFQGMWCLYRRLQNTN